MRTAATGLQSRELLAIDLSKQLEPHGFCCKAWKTSVDSTAYPLRSRSLITVKRIALDSDKECDAPMDLTFTKPLSYKNLDSLSAGEIHLYANSWFAASSDNSRDTTAQ